MDPNFVEIDTKFSADLHPSTLRDVTGSFQSILDGLLLAYREQLGGIVLAYHDERIVNKTASVHAFFPYFHVDGEATLSVLRLEASKMLVGKINKLAPDYIGILVLGAFNAVVYKDQLRGKFKFDKHRGCWVQNSDQTQQLKAGTMVKFAIERVEACDGRFIIVGSMLPKGCSKFESSTASAAAPFGLGLAVLSRAAIGGSVEALNLRINPGGPSALSTHHLAAAAAGTPSRVDDEGTGDEQTTRTKKQKLSAEGAVNAGANAADTEDVTAGHSTRAASSTAQKDSLREDADEATGGPPDDGADVGAMPSFERRKRTQTSEAVGAATAGGVVEGSSAAAPTGAAVAMRVADLYGDTSPTDATAGNGDAAAAGLQSRIKKKKRKSKAGEEGMNAVADATVAVSDTVQINGRVGVGADAHGPGETGQDDGRGSAGGAGEEPKKSKKKRKKSRGAEGLGQTPTGGAAAAAGEGPAVAAAAETTTAEVGKRGGLAYQEAAEKQEIPEKREVAEEQKHKKKKKMRRSKIAADVADTSGTPEKGVSRGVAAGTHEREARGADHVEAKGHGKIEQGRLVRKEEGGKKRKKRKRDTNVAADHPEVDDGAADDQAARMRNKGKTK